MEKPNSKVGILIRTKNRPLCVDRAIFHITCQTFDDWHIHILNDGGELKVLEQVIEKYKEKIKGRITIYNNETSLGRGNAANQLISLSNEEYIIIHDDDDTIEKHFLERTTSFLDDKENENCTGVVVSNYDVFEKIDENSIHILSKTDQYGKRDALFIDYLSYISSDIAIIPICLLFRRKTIYLSGSINGNLDYMEDYDFFTRLLMYGEFGIIRDTLASYHHRVNSNSDYDTTRNLMEQGHKDVYFNTKLRSAINGTDNLSKFICQSTIEARNKRYLLFKIEEMRQENKKSISLLVNTINALNAKIDIINNRNDVLSQSIQTVYDSISKK